MIHDLIPIILQRDWAFDQLIPNVREALLAKTSNNLQNLPLTALTAKHYRRMSLMDELSGHPVHSFEVVDRNTLSENSCEFWNKAASIVRANSELAWPTPIQIQKLHEALKIIQNSESVAYHHLYRHMSYLCPVTGTDFNSVSHPHFLGTIFLVLNENPSAMAISIIHELAHQELFLLNMVDRLVLPEKDRETSFAPFQKTKRPIIGRLHSAHALFRMISFEMLSGLGDLQNHKKILSETILTLNKNDITPFTGRLIDEVYTQIL